MDLSTIKFNYQSKIDKLNVRINRYQEIIEDYTVRINEAEKEDNPNISSVIKSKESYEHKIENMKQVKQYYQEFVNTADYLLQNLNNFDGVLEHSKIDHLEKENNQLKNNIAELEELTLSQSMKLKNFEIIESMDNNKIRKLRDTIKELRQENRDNSKIIKDLRDVTKGKESSKLRKANNKVRKLSAENEMLISTNDFLEKKNSKLERRIKDLDDYCNHLLSRRPDEPLTMGVKLGEE